MPSDCIERSEMSLCEPKIKGAMRVAGQQIREIRVWQLRLVKEVRDES